MRNDRTLVIVPCGAAKVWDREPGRGPTPAREAYTGAPFRVNRAYAERQGDAWVILSAKYGFLAPDAVIPGRYDVSFNRRSSDVVSPSTLRGQVHEQRLDRFARVVGLGGKEYRSVVQQAFADTAVRLAFPFAGLPIGRAMRAVKRATSSPAPGGAR